METIEIKRPVLIKAIITQAFKEQMIDESKRAVADIEKDIEIIKSNPSILPESGKQIEHLENMKKELLKRIEDFEKVEIGQILPFGTVEGTAKVKVGDSLLESLTKTEVVIKDWVVQEIK